MLSSVKKFVVENFLVVGFSFAAVVAMLWPAPGKYAASLTFGSGDNKYQTIELINNVLVFLVSGLSLKTDDLFALLRYWQLIAYGILTINFVTTLLALVMIRLPFATHEVSVGFAIFSSVPTTLGVGVALTLQAKGDQALSLLLTVLSNMLGSITIPYLLCFYLGGSGSSIHINPSHLALKLVYSVLIPTVLGISLRKYSTTVASFMVTYKTEMGLFSNSNLVCIVWMTLSSSRNAILRESMVQVLCIVLVAVAQHCFYLLYNYNMVRTLFPHVSLKQTISVTIMASQKSSPVALAVITNMGTAAMSSATASTAVAAGSGAGLYALPCVIGQLSQIFIGSVVASYFSKRMDDYDGYDTLLPNNSNSTVAYGSTANVDTKAIELPSNRNSISQPTSSNGQ